MGYERDRDERLRGGNNQSRWQGNRDRGDDRGFVERAGEEVRSWFSDDDRGDRGGYGREGGRNENVRWQGGSQGEFRGDPVHFREGSRGRDDRFELDSGRQRSASEYGNQGGSRYGAGGTGGSIAGDYDVDAGGPADTWGGSGYGGDYDRGRRFDRVDAGSTGTHGAHPMSAATGGGFAGIGGGMSGGSSAREYAIMRQAQGGGGQGGQAQARGYGQNEHHDRHYSEWRQRQIDELDRDYHEYRQEHQSKFEQEFGGWRQKRQTQRQHVGRAREHMEVLGSDGQHIGTVDKVRGDKIILTKNDENAGGVHHSIPCSWIENVDDKVIVNKTAQEAMQAWTDEDSNRALFERPDQGSDGPHVLNRSFSGTYDEKKG